MSTTDRGRAQGRPAHPGDVGRRIAHRREQLGLTREQVAAGSGMAANYLEYLESRPAAVDLETVTALAGTLGTSVWYLLGGGLDLPPGQASPAVRPAVEELQPWECWAKLEPGGVGRVALATPEGPEILPVNYRILDGTVLYRTTARSTAAAAVGERVAFEVDRLDEALGTGWSVLVTGPAHQVTEADAVEWFGRHADPRPWVGGERDTWVRIRPHKVTGRIIRTVETMPSDDTP
ncbi:pyridoxamine 5'-phosphate oxidase family protein [Kitasatospora sp. NPDC048540]|uniref:pyridoxamine 5'-phosphate oxidase family protein n=1 Tax=unclassified Kitasatospora TaxID=2633591 RepID=UPI00068CE24D|nr:pyridoxamine 5'-phosphate oxidase family protein [Kitasatospora sp. MBT63]